MISYAHSAEALEECPAVDTIAIANEMAWRLMPWKGLGQLSGDPLGGRIGGDIDPNKIPTRDPDDDETVQ